MDINRKSTEDYIYMCVINQQFVCTNEIVKYQPSFFLLDLFAAAILGLIHVVEDFMSSVKYVMHVQDTIS